MRCTFEIHCAIHLSSTRNQICVNVCAQSMFHFQSEITLNFQQFRFNYSCFHFILEWLLLDFHNLDKIALQNWGPGGLTIATQNPDCWIRRQNLKWHIEPRPHENHDATTCISFEISKLNPRCNSKQRSDLRTLFPELPLTNWTSRDLISRVLQGNAPKNYEHRKNNASPETEIHTAA